MPKVAITVNGSGPSNLFPAFIIGSSAVASGDDLVLFFTPAGSLALVKGEIEKMSKVKGLPDLVELYDGVVRLGGKICLCSLALEAKDLKKEDFRESVEIIGSTTFLNEIKDATVTFSF
jgi:predicted peroxiredoxin